MQNPSHTYSESGIYIITQTIHNPCFEDFAFDTINVVISSDKMIENLPFVSIYPNPGNGIFEMVINSLEMYNKIAYEVFYLNGQVLRKGDICYREGRILKQIDLSSMDTGLYYLKISFDEKMITQKIIIQ